MKVVKVLWVDSCNSNMNWTVTEDIKVEPIYIDSFGVVVKDTDEFLAIAQNYGDNPKQYSNITTIPKGCIKEVFVIHEDNVCENEQKPVDVRTTGYWHVENAEQNTDWSEEDEDMCYKAIAVINRLCAEGKDYVWSIKTLKKLFYWLKSLKERIVPQTKQEWKQENTVNLTDFENAMMHIGNSFFGNNAGLDPNNTNAIKEQANLLLELVPKKEWSKEDEQYLLVCKNALAKYQITDKLDAHIIFYWLENKLKSLRPQSTWKTSDEQITVLHDVAAYVDNSLYPNQKQILINLYLQLKKLQGE